VSKDTRGKLESKAQLKVARTEPRLEPFFFLAIVLTRWTCQRHGPLNKLYMGVFLNVTKRSCPVLPFIPKTGVSFYYDESMYSWKKDLVF